MMLLIILNILYLDLFECPNNAFKSFSNARLNLKKIAEEKNKVGVKPGSGKNGAFLCYFPGQAVL